MKYSNSIEYNISTKFDSSGLTKLKSELAQLELTLQNAGNKKQLFHFDEYRAQIQGLGDALTEAFNPSLGIINLKQFGAALKENNVTAQGLREAFKAAGADGQVAFNNLVGQIGQLDTGIKRTSSAVDKMFTTFSNTFRWGLVSSFWSQFLNAIHSSVEYTKELDDSLTQIMLVTDYSRDSMNEYAKAANEAAKAVGQTTVGMTNASLIFAQQGYDLNQSQQLATLSAKLANASQQDTAATSDQITAYMNAYGLQDNMEELAQAMDNWALIANISAADVEEIALASQRAASMANAVGVSGEALAAQIATIESVTREAPEQIGNGLKTLYARFSDLQLGKKDEDGITLGKVTGTLESIGVQVLDSLGNVRSMDDIMEDLMAIWQDLDDTTQEAVAQTLAGKHQVNRFTALMDNADMYQEYLGATGENAAGTLEQMNQEYMDSLQGRMATLQATLEGLFNDVFTTDLVYPLIDALTRLAEVFDTLFKSVGGGSTVILGLVSAFTRLFSTNIARSINDASLNKALQAQRAANLEDKQTALTYLGLANPNPEDASSQAILNYAQQMNSMSGSFNTEQMNRYNTIFKEMVVNANAASTANEELKTKLQGLNIVANMIFGQGTESFIDEGAVNTTALIESLQGKTEAFKNSLSFIQEAQANFGDLSEGTTKLLDNIQRGLKAGNVDVEEYTNNIADLRFALDLLKTALPKDKVRELSELFDKAQKDTENWAKDGLPELMSKLKGTQLNINNVVKELKNFIKANKDLTPEQIENYIQELEKLAAKTKIAKEVSGLSNKTGSSAIDVARQQQQTKSIINTVGAIGQLASAWQSLANLPSIWSNDDLTGSEKLLQTITNLSFVIPSFVSSFRQLTGITSLTELSGAFSGLFTPNKLQEEAANARDRLTEAQNRAKQAAEGLAQANSRLAAAEKAAKESGEKNARSIGSYKGQVTKALNNQAQAEKELNEVTKENEIVTKKAAAAQQAWKLGATIAVAAIMLVISAISAYSKYLQQAAQNSANAFNDTLSKTKIDTSHFNELYDEYKRTGVASEELKEEGSRLAQELGIVGGSALAASGNFDQLAQSISNSTDEMSQMLEEDASRALNDANVAANDYFANHRNVDKAGIDWYDWANADITEKYGLVTDMIAQEEELSDQLDARIAELEAKPNRTAQENAELETARVRRNTSLRRRQAGEALLADEGALGSVDDITLAMADSAAESLSTTEFEGMNYDEIVANLTDPAKHEWIAKYYATLGGEDAQAYMDALIQGVSPEAWNEHLETMATSGLDEVQNVIAQNAVRHDGTQFRHVGEEGFAELTRVAEELNLSEQDTASLVGLFDWSDPEIDQKVMELVANIRADVEAGLSAENIVVKYTVEPDWEGWDQQLDYTQEQAEKILKDAGLEGMSVDEYAQSFLEMGGAGLVDTADNVETITEEIDRLNKELKGVEEGSEEWKILNQQLENANDRLRNMALAALQTRNGMQQLASSWDSIQKNLSSTDLTDQVIGYQTLQPILGEIFNVDPSIYTTDFMQGLYDEGLLEDLVNGAEGALDAVREYYLNNPVGLRAYLESEGFAESADELLEIARGIDGLNLEVGATLNDGEFIDALNNMLRNGQIGVEQLRAMFSNVGGGYDVQIDYVPVDFPNVDIAIQSAKSVASAVTDMFGLEGKKQQSAVTSVMNSVKSQVKASSTAMMPTVSLVPLGSGSTPSAGRVGKGGGGKSCFVAGTLVSTVDSFKEIENIQVGDIVLSYNEEIHQNEYSVVLQTMIHDVTEEIYDLYIENEILNVTGIHRFYIRRKHDIEWIPASDLCIGDYVLFADGTWHVISNIEVKVQSTTVYNFEVSYNHNYYVGRNQILAHNKGGGGGGGGGNTNTMEYKDSIDHEVDYYEEIDSQLDKIGETLSGIEKEEDRIIGEKARQNQAKQIALLEKEIGLQDKKLGILQREQNDVLNNVDTSTTAIANNINQTLTNATQAEKNAVNVLKGILNDKKFAIPKITFDDENVISNFETISQKLDDAENKLIEKYNKLIDQYNASNSDAKKEEIEALDKIIGKFDEEANKIKENIQRYNDLQTEAQQLKNTVADLQDQIEDLRIEAYKGSLDALDNLKEINETAASFAGIMTGLKTDDPLREMTERLSKINHTFKMTKEEAKGFLESMRSDMVTEASQKYFNDLIKGLSESDLTNGRIGFLAKELEKLRNWGLGGKNNPFGNNQKAWLETYNEVYKKLEEAASEYQEEEEGVVDTIIDYYDEIDEKQQDYMDQFEQLADKMEWLKDIYSIRYGDESYQALSDIGTKQAEVLQSSLAQQVHIYDLWAKRYKEALDSHDEELARDARQRMDEAEKNMQDLAKESAETFVDAYNDAIDAAIQKMYNNVLGDTENNLDHLDRNWEWDKKNIDGYRDEVERTFEVEQLRSKYNDLLNSAQGSSLATQNKIRQQMAEQIKLLEDQKTMSEYDVKLANSKLTILQKQIALEDAQRNKNQMQLRRDTQGNYRYVYRASQNDIAKARQEYIQAVQDAYELTKDQRQQTAKELADALKDYAKAYEDVSKNVNLPAEQRARELQELTDRFREFMQNLQEDLGDTGAGLSDVLGFMIKNGTDDVAEVAQQMLSKLGKLGTGEGTGIPWLDALAGYSKIADANIEDVTTKLLGQTAKDAEELSQQLDKVFSTIPTKITEYTETINDTQNKTDALTDSTKAYLDTLELLPDKMQKGLAEIIKYNEELPKFLKLLEDVDKVTQDLTRLYTDELPFNLSMDASQYNAPNNEWAPVLHNNYSDKQHLGDRITSGIEEKWVMVPGSIEQYGWPIFEKQIISHFKSGGYTGKWGKDGKLAVLHEKELVLNAQDTENVYAAIKAAKQFVASLGAKSLRNYMNSKPVFNAGTDSIEQRVEIKAEFPNVRDSFEIERALINLSDNAYQYAHRNI